jgi:tRNA U34 5-carboxymethylaminomethyl modifying GTPase MnmE/TrmE
MPSQKSSLSKQSKAEDSFRAAFERLKSNAPNLLPKGTIITQNNIAREAGVDPSAFKKSRFPRLIDEIKNWLDSNKQVPLTSRRQQLISNRNRIKALQERMDMLKSQRDNALTLLADADILITELSLENTRLKKLLPNSNITSLLPSNSVKDSS